MIERIIHNNELYALILKADFKSEGIEFFTPNEYPLQMGYMNRKKGYKIPRHKHSLVDTKTTPGISQEILIMKSGLIKVDIYDAQEHFISTVVITAGDVIMFIKGGHGFEMLEPSDFIEIKQGPYGGLEEKILF